MIPVLTSQVANLLLRQLAGGGEAEGQSAPEVGYLRDLGGPCQPPSLPEAVPQHLLSVSWLPQDGRPVQALGLSRYFPLLQLHRHEEHQTMVMEVSRDLHGAESLLRFQLLQLPPLSPCPSVRLSGHDRSAYMRTLCCRQIAAPWHPCGDNIRAKRVRSLSTHPLILGLSCTLGQYSIMCNEVALLRFASGRVVMMIIARQTLCLSRQKTAKSKALPNRC